MKQFRYLPILLLAITSTTGCDRSQPTGEIAGASMYPVLAGEHFSVTCGRCQFPFIFDAHKPPRSGLAVCPNCGFRSVEFSEQNKSPASSATILRDSAIKINRWDVVAFTQPDKTNERFLVKRAVGLPGETVNFKNGNLYSGARLIAKPWDVFLTMRQHVFDSKYLPNDESSTPRFHPIDRQNSGWKMAAAKWQHGNRSGESESADEFDWLRYRHVRGYRHYGEADSNCPIEDNSSYNQNLSRDLFPVPELQVELELDCSVDTSMEIKLTNSVNLSCRFDAETIVVTADGKPVGEMVRGSLPQRRSTVSVAAFDDQIMITLDRQIVFQEHCRLGNGPTAVFIGAKRGGGVTVHRTRIFRDNYYLPHTAESSDGYFVLGDNSPVSVDSRKFGAVDRRLIWGKVVFE